MTVSMFYLKINFDYARSDYRKLTFRSVINGYFGIVLNNIIFKTPK
jgi:hypothetical protein